MMRLILVSLAVLATSATVLGANRFQLGEQSTGDFCQGCRSIISYASRINSTAERPAYKEIFLSYCELYYPNSNGFGQGPCPGFVEELFSILDLIEPMSHCDQIGACRASRSSLNYNNEFSQLGDGMACGVCRNIVKQVKAKLNDPEVTDQMQEKMHKLCDALAAAHGDKECRKLVDKYLDQALDFVRTLDEQKYCASIQMCPRRIFRVPKLSIERDSGMCVDCVDIITRLAEYLSTHPREHDFSVLIDQVCDKIADESRRRIRKNQCVMFVATMGKDLEKAISTMENPRQLCTKMELCRAPSRTQLLTYDQY